MNIESLTKTCPCCKETKPLDSIHFKYKNEHGIRRACYCRPCWNKFKKGGRKTKGLYTRDPITKKTSLTEEHKLAVKRKCWNKNRQERKLKERMKCREHVFSLLQNSNCVDCGYSNILALEFDHRNPEEKQYDISSILNNGSLKKLLKEIEKCDIVCRNCHAIRTQKMFGSWRIDYL